MNKIDYFLNDRMKVLLVIKQHLIDVGGTNVCPLNQIEIALFVGCSKVKVNQLLKELIESGYVVAPQKGRYILTSSANEIINRLGE